MFNKLQIELFILCVAEPTVDLKLALTAETKSWMVDYGHHCNRKYRMEMEQIFTFIDEASKKLNRPIKDLDDIRIAMATLKEIREHQISVDFQVGPIEVHINIEKNKTCRVFILFKKFWHNTTCIVLYVLYV